MVMCEHMCRKTLTSPLNRYRQHESLKRTGDFQSQKDRRSNTSISAQKTPRSLPAHVCQSRRHVRHMCPISEGHERAGRLGSLRHPQELHCGAAAFLSGGRPPQAPGEDGMEVIRWDIMGCVGCTVSTSVFISCYRTAGPIAPISPQTAST